MARKCEEEAALKALEQQKEAEKCRKEEEAKGKPSDNPAGDNLKQLQDLLTRLLQDQNKEKQQVVQLQSLEKPSLRYQRKRIQPPGWILE